MLAVWRQCCPCAIFQGKEVNNCSYWMWEWIHPWCGFNFQGKVFHWRLPFRDDGRNFQNWLTELVIPNLPPRSVVVIDNAPYHIIQVDKCPTLATKVVDIKSWLDRHGDTYTYMLKAEVLQLCKDNQLQRKHLTNGLHAADIHVRKVQKRSNKTATTTDLACRPS